MNNKASKDYLLKLLKDKEINGLSFSRIAELTGYSISQVKKLKRLIEEKDIDSLTKHAGIGNNNHTPKDLEIQYIVEFKKQYPVISISQFQDYYQELVIWNKAKQDDVIKYGLKTRSYSFFQALYKKFNWTSPCKRKIRSKRSSHSLREPMPKRGMLIMIDGTPHDWFQNGKKFSLHLAIDDATGEYLAGWFSKEECLESYCHLLLIILTKYGIPENIYSDKHTILKSPNEYNLTTFGKICEDFGINHIFANSPEAKGKVERANRTIQGRLLNDVTRNGIKTYSELNTFFNNEYCKYLNHKFAYNLEKESVFIKLEYTHDVNSYFCVRVKRQILNDNVISYNDIYYKLVNAKDEVVHLYKGTNVEVRENIFTKEITVKYDKAIYKTILIEKRNKKDRVQTLISDQKELINYFENKQ